jgi:hypothetical protein
MSALNGDKSTCHRERKQRWANPQDIAAGPTSLDDLRREE